MYERILVPLDGSVTAIRGLREAMRLAGVSGGQLILLHVIDDFPTAWQRASGEPLDDQKDKRMLAAEEMLRRSVDSTHVAGIGVHTEVCPASDSAADSIVEYATRLACGLIVIGTHGRSGIRRAALGSVAEQVSRRSTVPVLLVPPAPDDEPN